MVDEASGQNEPRGCETIIAVLGVIVRGILIAKTQRTAKIAKENQTTISSKRLLS